MDFVVNTLFGGRRFRALTVVDNYSWKYLEIEGADVVCVMERMKPIRCIVPQRIKVDNSSEFISKVLDKRAFENGVVLDFSRFGKPADNAFIESFNGSFRDECLNVKRMRLIAAGKQTSRTSGAAGRRDSVIKQKLKNDYSTRQTIRVLCTMNL